MDTTVTLAVIISVIALVSSFVVPLLTVIINNRNRRRTWENEFYVQHRAKVIESYVRATGQVVRMHTEEAVAEYGRTFGEILVYISDPALIKKMEELDTKINKFLAKDPSAVKLFYSICEDLRKSPPRMS